MQSGCGNDCDGLRLNLLLCGLEHLEVCCWYDVELGRFSGSDTLQQNYLRFFLPLRVVFDFDFVVAFVGGAESFECRCLEWARTAALDGPPTAMTVALASSLFSVLASTFFDVWT